MGEYEAAWRPLANTEKDTVISTPQSMVPNTAGAADSTPVSEVPTQIFIYELAWLIFLMIEAILAYTLLRPLFSAISVIPIPLSVPWFGALGAVIVGLYGIFNHARTWSDDYLKWHWARPFTGAALAIAAFVIFHVLVQAAATGSAVSTGKTSTDAAFFYDALAFLIGYSDKTFAQLLQRLTSVLLGPGQSHSPQNDPRDKSDGNPTS